MSEPTPPPKSPSTPTLVAAGFVLLGYTAFIYFMLGKVESEDLAWARYAWLFASVEAVAFAAAGALFGVAVQRDRVTSAEAKATHAEKRAEDHQDAAARGRSLASVLKADAAAWPAEEEALEGFGSGSEPSAPAPTEAAGAMARRYGALANELFPDD